MLVFNRPAKKQLQKSFLHTFCCRYEWLKKNPKDISGNPFSRSLSRRNNSDVSQQMPTTLTTPRKLRLHRVQSRTRRQHFAFSAQTAVTAPASRSACK